MISNDQTSQAISTVHPDIIQTHILTRLDGPTLASAACASSQLHTLSSNDTLWRQICNNTWPSTSDPLVHQIIDKFPSRHRSFFSDSFPSLHNKISQPQPPPAKELVSAVDLKFQNHLIFSRVQQTETNSGWFMTSPFRVDLLDPKETVETGAQLPMLDACLENSLSLSWVLIDPTRTRAANFSSLKPVSVTRHWLTGDLHVRFATVLEREGEHVMCAAVVTCKGDLKGELHVKEVSLVVEDMEGRGMNGEDSLVILQDAMENYERRLRKEGDARVRYEEYMEKRRERRKKKQMKEQRMDMVCVFTVVTLLITCASLLIKISS